MRTLVTVTFAHPAIVLEALACASEYHKRPDGWRESEYAMTKGHALESTRAIAAQLEASKDVTLDLFDWSLLQGELLRYHIATKNPAVVAVYQAIVDGIAANPEAARRVAKSEEYERKKARAAKLKAEADALEQEMIREDAEAKFAAQLAALPCGGCRQATCSHCVWALGLEPTEEQEEA